MNASTPSLDRPRPSPLVVLVALALGAPLTPALAFQIETDLPDVKLRWDNTFKYSAATRLRDRDPRLTVGNGDPNAINSDDGARNFAKGLISNRLDWLTEADVSWRTAGARISAAAWYDTVYNRGNDNDSANFFGPGTSTANTRGVYNEFTAGTRKLHGRKAEVLDAFVYNRFDIGGTSTTVRVGQHALVWGESLFLGSNAIAGAQGPTDIVKALSVPNSQVKELVRPVPQVSMQSILTPDVSIGAYYQFRYVRNRYPGVGSYFSPGDQGPDGAEVALLGPVPIPVGQKAVKDSGQFGVQLKTVLGDTDVGFYALRFHNKAFQLYPSIGLTPAGPAPTSFDFAYKEGITAYGVSFSHTFGRANVAGEASIRRNTDLSSTRGSDASSLGAPGLPYAVGNTAHANLSTLWTVPRTPLWADATFIGEIAWNRMLSCHQSCAAMPETGTRDAWQLAAVMTPTYYQVVPGLNLSVPVGLNYTPKGSRSLALGAGPSGAENGGSFNVGVQGLYQDAWRFGLTYTRFFGTTSLFVVARPGVNNNNYAYQQPLRDRDYLAFSLSRTF